MAKDRIEISLELFEEIKRVIKIMWDEGNTCHRGHEEYNLLSMYIRCGSASLENYNRILEIVRKY